MEPGNTEVVFGIKPQECKVVSINILTLGESNQKMPSFIPGVATVIGSNPNVSNNPNDTSWASQEAHIIIKGHNGEGLTPNMLSNRALRIMQVGEGISLTNLKPEGEMKYWLNGGVDKKLEPGKHLFIENGGMESVYIQLAPGVFIGKKPGNIN